METLKNNIKLVSFIAPVVADEDSEPTSTVIDTHETEASHFDGALVRARAGTFGADLTGITITIQESDNADGSSPSTARGGEAQTLSAAGEVVFQVERSKRYLLALVVMAAGGAADTAPLAVSGILHNWAAPLPLI